MEAGAHIAKVYIITFGWLLVLSSISKTFWGKEELPLLSEEVDNLILTLQEAQK